MKYFFTPQKLGVVILYHLRHFTFILPTESLSFGSEMAGLRLVVQKPRGGEPQSLASDLQPRRALALCRARRPFFLLHHHQHSATSSNRPPKQQLAIEAPKLIEQPVDNCCLNCLPPLHTRKHVSRQIPAEKRDTACRPQELARASA